MDLGNKFFNLITALPGIVLFLHIYMTVLLYGKYLIYNKRWRKNINNRERR